MKPQDGQNNIWGKNVPIQALKVYTLIYTHVNKHADTIYSMLGYSQVFMAV